MMIRNARLSDIPRLVEIEQNSFSSRTVFMYEAGHFRHIIKRANADLLVIGKPKEIYGYALLLYRKKSKYCRLYSIAIDSAHRKKGLGRKLFKSAENAALARQCQVIHLEVRANARRNQRIYSNWGCEKTNVYPRHYPDNMDAIRMDKCLAVSKK